MNNTPSNREYLGQGWAFPVQVDRRTGRIKMVSYEDDVAEAIRIILTTRKGERVMRPTFGCDIFSFMFGSNDYSQLKLIEREIRKSLREWEHRIEKVEVNAVADAADGGRVNIEITYNIVGNNNTFNLVYPFYLDEGLKPDAK